MTIKNLAHAIVRRYPAAWRARYGQELLDTIGARPIGTQHLIDLAMGAVDAWLSPEVRRAVVRSQAAGAGKGGHVILQQLKLKCATSSVPYTKRDALVSAGVMILGTVLLLLAGIGLSRENYPVLGDALKSLAFPVAMVMALPFAITKGQPARAQIATAVVTITMLVTATWIATQV